MSNTWQPIRPNDHGSDESSQVTSIWDCPNEEVATVATIAFFRFKSFVIHIIFMPLGVHTFVAAATKDYILLAVIW